MDDSAQPIVPVQPVMQVPAPIATQAPVTQAPVFHPQAVGGPKESVPFSNRPIEAPVAEYVQPTEVAPTIPQEVAEAGVEASPNHEQPNLDSSHQKAGIELSGHAQIVPIATGPVVQLPYTFEQATQIENATTTEDSRHWLVSLSKYIMRKIQLKGEE